MPAFEWTDALAVGVDAIDSDHKVLIDQINMLSDAMETGGDATLVSSVINVLIDYTAYHFDRERQMMDATGFPDSVRHLKEHDLMVFKVKAMQDAYAAGQGDLPELFKFLKVWLTHHIMKSDQAFASHIKATKGAHLVPPPPALGAINWNRLSVLVVDDQYHFRSLMRNILNTLGITQIQEAKDGAEAMERLNTSHADVILVDDEMSPCDGLQFTRMVRGPQSPAPKAVVILMPSKEITREYVREATEAGVHDLMLKPLAPKTVRARIEHHLTNPVPFRKVDDRLVPVRRAPAPAAKQAQPGAA
ncbi:bacteriohemerythrin [Novispirillum sp. DQ9]|uniref:bacteriohemerythrin n=1 Tax=Novispirillum sp. DQ9 TaxID=3398612 RepID=UPI003C7D24CB